LFSSLFSSEAELFDVIKQYSISFYAKNRNISGEHVFKEILAILCSFGGATKYQGLVRPMEKTPNHRTRNCLAKEGVNTINNPQTKGQRCQAD